MIAECYSLHLYCRNAPESKEGTDHPFDPRHSLCGPAEFTGNNKRDAWASARRAGWRLDRDGDITCPLCCADPRPHKFVPCPTSRYCAACPEEDYHPIHGHLARKGYW